jgi:hypothetical protein
MMNGIDSASGQINIPLYHFTGSNPGIIFIILPQGRCSFGHVLITYDIDGEINHNSLILLITGVCHIIKDIYHISIDQS